MKKLFTLFAAFMLAGLWLNAQTPLEQAVNFTATDVFGVEHTLFDYLDDDKMVVIQFTMVG
ncbi:MAG: hypothetical protein IH597_04455 [Bacteroidales bacterium]|nr:hypothetical protein [Bacteroidales bacterium]